LSIKNLFAQKFYVTFVNGELNLYVVYFTVPRPPKNADQLDRLPEW